MPIASELIKGHREDLAKNAKPGSTVHLNLTAVTKILSQNWYAFHSLLKCVKTAMTPPITSASCELYFTAMK